MQVGHVYKNSYYKSIQVLSHTQFQVTISSF
jgi:hypothetical protein